MNARIDGTAPRIAGVIIDVPAGRFDDTVAFWTDVLSATPEGLEGMPGADAYVELRGAAAVTDVLVQRIDDADRPRFHLDVAVADRAAAVAQAERLGGRSVHREERWEVIVDPAGLPLCVGFEDPDPLQVGARRPDRGHLDAVFLDVPAADVAAEVAFWSDLLDAEVDSSEAPYHQLVGVRAVGGAPLGLYVQATASDPTRDGVAAAPRMHIDLSASDVAAEAARLERLGARHIADVEDWITLADPAGNLFCVVPLPEAAHTAAAGGGDR